MQLNPQQQEAVECTEGPLLIIAGAGSGKTRVLTQRIAYLITEKQVNPWNILAITFTNKAAGEMRERVDQLSADGSSVWVSTFHSTCVRILRRYIDRLGYDTNFTIYDTDDQKHVIKDIIKMQELDTRIYKDRSLLAAISAAKNELISPEEYLLNAAGDWNSQVIGKAYAAYQHALKQNNALDFDDLLMKTVELFQSQPDVLDSYQERFLYLMVDEYQDTNTAQFELVRLLAKKYRNLCVVGDDDQSIYRFRGANIRNILDFEKNFPDARVIKLEQNYRSTQNILNAANAVIANNHGRKKKTLWSEKDEGEKVHFRQFMNAFEEAEYVAGEILSQVREGAAYSDFAVLYRTNAQSRMFEEKFLMASIPYRLVGGLNFYARKEVKDLLSYLKTIDNARDDLAVRRIVNVPKRGIGAASLNKAAAYAEEQGMSLYEAMRRAGEIPGLAGRAADKIKGFTTYIDSLKAMVDILSVEELLNKVIDQTGYVRELEAEDTEEARNRIDNINELITKVVTYEEGADEPTLSGFLSDVALVADIDEDDEDTNKVLLMTLHSAKGLEFPRVFLTGLEDGIFPSYMTITSDDPMELEEERRLCYVGITRAMDDLTITSAKQRMIRGETQYNKVSRFVHEIPRELVDLGRDTLMERKKPDPPVDNAWRKARQEFRKPAAYSQTMFDKPALRTGGSMLNAQTAPDYAVGDTVRHIKFGTGMVLNIVKGGKDYEVTVDFEKFGVKKMFAAFAKLQKI